MDLLWIIVAFVLGFAARQVGLPPLVGFLTAGFVLNAIDVSGGEILQEIADLGVTLLLFSIGLKLRIGSLLKPEVWLSAWVHMLISAGVLGAGIYGLGVAGFSLFSGVEGGPSLLIAFALSFSSTVFAVKVLDEKGEMGSLHGRVSIGILIIQDLVAVLFLAVSAGKIPSPWAFLLLALLPVRPLLMALMNRSGHGELLILFGLLLAVAGAEGFELVGVKGDLGALILGVLLAGHPKASELAKSLLGFKDIFLVGFFLSIGLYGVPTLEAIGVAALLALIVPFKVALFFLLMTRLRLRARTSLLAALSLANYSEFGLIVGAIGASQGWIGGEWLVTIAVALSITFILASPLNSAAHSLYARFHERLRTFETETRLPYDEPIDPGEATIVIFGMGRVGTGAFDVMSERFGHTVLGLDADPATVREHQQAGRNVILGDATDSDFWEKVEPSGKVHLVMLAMPKHAANMFAARRLAGAGYPGLVTATTQFDDDAAELRSAGVQAAFNFYAEAGAGFAEHACRALGEKLGCEEG